MVRQAGPTPFPFKPYTTLCRRCGRPFVKNRRKKVYCSPVCQNPYHDQNISLEHRRESFQSMNALMETQNHHELIEAFERETGTPFTVKLVHMPRKRHQLPILDPKEEQGGVWWNQDQDPDPVGELDPAQIERRLKYQMPVPAAHQGETPDEWKARGNIVKVLPPGQALALGGPELYRKDLRYESYNQKKKGRPE